MFERNDPCFCGSGKKYKKCCYPKKPAYTSADLKQKYLQDFGIILKTDAEIAGIKKASRLAAKILDLLCQKAQAGVTTNELNELAENLHQKYGAVAAPLGYGTPPFPKSICTSPNEVICHGIPNDEKLQEGDFLNIDVTTILNGYYGDCSRMVAIGKISMEKKRVMDTSYQCLMEAVKICRPGLKIFEIGGLIETIAKKNNCSVVNQFVGHGVGVSFHEPPQIPHHYNNLQIPLVERMIFTIEPMINAGVKEAVIDYENQWTARTADLKPSAQWEHTLLITAQGAEILTQV
ncbi:MAG: methionyl aminopeptidase [Parachlamydiales bacterium]|jgi:methionyl aminopeptidase